MSESIRRSEGDLREQGEKKDEILTKQEIQEFLLTCVEGDSTEPRILEDDKGVYLFELSVLKKNGESVVYSYNREGNFPECQSGTTTVYKVYFEGDMPVGGDVIADFVDHRWVMK